VEDSNPNDIDIAVIFNKIPLKDQLNQAQDIKKQLSNESDKPIHINAYDYYSLLDVSNFAKENILLNGRSIITGEYFASRFGLTPRVQIHYSLKGMKKKDKVRFNYMLNGKKGEYGLLRKYGGRILKPGLIEVAPECREIFLDSIRKLSQDYYLKLILELSNNQ
jgi:GTPase SAR1 family protein